MDRESLEAVLSQKIQVMHSGHNPSNRLRTPYPAKDINEFFPLLNEVIAIQLAQDGDNSSIQLLEEMPEIDDNITGEIITFSLSRRLPGVAEAVPQGLMSNERRIRDRRKELRETFEDPENPGMVICTYGQEFDNWITFTIWARTSKVANERAMWFEDLMTNWAWYFQLSGVKRVVFEERGADIRISPENRKVVGRPFSYYVRTEKITVVREAALRSILISSSLKP